MNNDLLKTIDLLLEDKEQINLFSQLSSSLGSVNITTALSFIDRSIIEILDATHKFEKTRNAKFC